MKRTSRKPSKLSESVQRHLNAYALAASAAGVGVLALTQPVEAKIIYTKTHQVLGDRGKLRLDFNRDRITDFTISQRVARASDNPLSGYAFLKVFPAKNTKNQIWGTKSYSRGGSHRMFSVASALNSGVSIGPNSVKFQPHHSVMNTYWDDGGPSSSGTVVGQWKKVQNKYLAVKFYGQSGEVHYGWARLSADFYQHSATLTGYAYETVPNKPIITGHTKGPDVITLDPGSLGGLAAGASGRDRRK